MLKSYKHTILFVLSLVITSFATSGNADVRKAFCGYLNNLYGVCFSEASKSSTSCDAMGDQVVSAIKSTGEQQNIQNAEAREKFFTLSKIICQGGCSDSRNGNQNTRRNLDRLCN